MRYLSPTSLHKSTRSAFFFLESHIVMFNIACWLSTVFGERVRLWVWNVADYLHLQANNRELSEMQIIAKMETLQNRWAIRQNVVCWMSECDDQMKRARSREGERERRKRELQLQGVIIQPLLCQRMLFCLRFGQSG